METSSRLSRHWLMKRGPCALIGVLLAIPAGAQQKAGSWEVKAVVGLAGFLDNRTDHRFAIGGAVRAYVSPRFAIEPEFQYMRRDDLLQDFLIQGNLVREFVRNDTAHPYLIGGIGILHRREKFPGAAQPAFSSNSLTGSGGVGVRIRLKERFSISPEFRLGTEPLYRATLAIGRTFETD